ncbi:putative B3 domain-containing protein Os04g0347400 isoform X3 [Panicum hallii]|uniref:putative B3 domain-containing protein Os04g0347400 isoform X3 n=1 Tax=Panicum hallii TaxID=206008 RepID=UPI000DF4EBF4|nr:putative B3 domain-containing protein Os04g0347400 isoform X3 [Panicum hallii]
MASSAGRGGAEIKHPRVLLPFTCDSLRIPDELAEGIGAGEALVVGPASGTAKHWRVEVGWDGDGAFLGRGWPEFADACGVEAGWLLVLRHRGQGLLTVKAFDANCCLRELPAPSPPAVGATASSKDASRKPQFIRVHSRDFMEKLLIPAEFVQQYLSDENLNNRAWSQFLVFHYITEADALLLRYEGNMVFTVKVFGLDGYQRDSKHKETRAKQVSTSADIEEQERQEAPSFSIQKHCKNKVPGSAGEKKPKGIVTPINEESSWMKPVYEIGPPLFVKKQINANTLKELALAKPFCDAIGLHGPCIIITLKTSMSNTESWKVHAVQRKDMGYRLLQGWRLFCSDNSIELGDICTFTVIETTVWDVIATRCKETINHLCNETPSASSRKHNTMNNESSNKGEKRPKVSMTALNKTSPRGCVFEIGPPAWIKKEINSTTVENRLYLPPVFCEAIGILKPCTVTLKTSMSCTRSWQARVAPYDGSSHHVSGPGWRQFCRENRIKVGEICTINIFKTTLWHVIISSPE